MTLCLFVVSSCYGISLPSMNQQEGWRMVKSETRRDDEILVRNPSPRLLSEKFRDSKKVKTNHEKMRLRKCFRDFDIRPKFSETHVFRGTICHS